MPARETSSLSGARIGLCIFIALLAAHFWLLRLPYFWDEAGYYIPAAHELFESGRLLPTDTLFTGHTPLLSIYLTLLWKLFDFQPLVTRVGMVAVAAMALVEVWRVARIACPSLTKPGPFAVSATTLTAVFPVFFAQSTMAHSDIMAAAFTLCGLRLWLDDARWKSVAAFALAAMSKETAIIVPLALVALAVWERWRGRSDEWRSSLPLLLAGLPLVGWYALVLYKTGHAFGEESYFRYNLGETLHPLRALLALVQRGLHLFGHMNMFLFAFAALVARLLWPKTATELQSKKTPITGVSVQAEMSKLADIARANRALLAMAAIIAVNWLFYSLVGGALLTRYLLAAYPLVIILLLRTIAARTEYWKAAAALVFAAFIAGWWISPPYRITPEDNLSYKDFVELQQNAIGYLKQGHTGARVLTAWPASDEMTKPWLGYVDKPFFVVRVDDFSAETMLAARSNADYDTILAFSTKDQPSRRLQWPWWQKMNQRFFHDHEDLDPVVLATLFHGKVLFREDSPRGWVAVIKVDHAQDARSVPATRALPKASAAD